MTVLNPFLIITRSHTTNLDNSEVIEVIRIAFDLEFLKNEGKNEKCWQKFDSNSCPLRNIDNKSRSFPSTPREVLVFS